MIVLNTSLPTRAIDPRAADLETAIAARVAERRTKSTRLAHVERELAAVELTKRAIVIGRDRDRADAKARAAALVIERDTLIERLAELEQELDTADAARAQIRSEIDAAIATPLRDEIHARTKAVDAALTVLLPALDALRAVAEHADAQLSDPATGRRGARALLSSEQLAVAHAFYDISAERIASWRGDVAQAFR